MAHISGAESPLRVFGAMEGREIREVTLRIADAEARILEFGAVVRDLKVRRPDGAMQRVVLGLNSVEEYIAHSPYFGAIAGRFANRIAHGQFTLDGCAYQLVLNQDGRHTLHGGGPTGIGKRPWTVVHHETATVTLVHVSTDGTNGFPGTLQVTCRYTLAPPATLRVELWATTDAPTIVNLCHHSYFNLNCGADILDHTLTVHGDQITMVNSDLIPSGVLADVAGGDFDFRNARPVRRIAADGTRVWYDHNYMLRRDRTARSVANGLDVAHAATFASPISGVSLDVWTTEPALQVYDGFKVNVTATGLDGARYGANAGLCLEPQHVPNSPNLPQFPSTVLRPDGLYRQVTEYRFGA
jgi:aldose 1-epimerase